MNLYQISTEYSQILDELYDDEGVVNELMLAKLEQNELAMEKKAIAIACYIKNMDAERVAIETAKKSMAEREKHYKKRIDELEGYLVSGMERRGITHIKCPYFDIKLKKCPPSVSILDEKSLPREYTRTKTEILPDKIKMKEEMMVGVLIPGASLITNLRLEIK